MNRVLKPHTSSNTADISMNLNESSAEVPCTSSNTAISLSLTESSAECAVEVLQEPTVLNNSNENLVAVEPDASKLHVTETESDILNHPEHVTLKYI